MTESPLLDRLVRGCVLASGLVSIVGITFLVLFFTLGGAYGPLNDAAIVVQYVLMLPIAFWLHRRLRSANAALSRGALVIGITGIMGVILLQILLLAGVLPFARQIGPVSVAFLVAMVWFIMTGRLGRGTGLLPESTALHVLAGLYVGYPFWAFSVWRRTASRA